VGDTISRVVVGMIKIPLAHVFLFFSEEGYIGRRMSLIPPFERTQAG
jgi:hypothetical protein